MSDFLQEVQTVDARSDTSQGTVIPDGKYSFMEFALLNFRDSQQKWVQYLIMSKHRDTHLIHSVFIEEKISGLGPLLILVGHENQLYGRNAEKYLHTLFCSAERLL